MAASAAESGYPPPDLRRAEHAKAGPEAPMTVGTTDNLPESNEVYHKTNQGLTPRGDSRE